MSIKGNRKGKFSSQTKKRICGVGIFVLGAMYLLGRNNYEPSAENSIWNAFFVKYAKEEESSLTNATLEKYNTFLRKIGSNKQLTEKDLEAIMNSDYSEVDKDEIISIQVDEFEFNQISTIEYNVCVDEKGELILNSSDLRFKKDFLKNTKSQELEEDNKKTILATVGEFILENGIEPIGYIDSWSSWNDKEVHFVLENYGEDVLDCMQENGFPIKAYAAQDFYEAYEKVQGVTR